MYQSNSPATSSYSQTVSPANFISDLQCFSALVLCVIVSGFTVSLSPTIQSASISSNSSMALLNVVVLIISCIICSKFYKGSPNLGSVFLLSVSSIVLSIMSHTISFITLPLCIIVPAILLWLTKSYAYCIVSLITQIINILLLFRGHIEQAARTMSIEHFADRMAQSLILVVLGTTFVFAYLFHIKENSDKEKNIPVNSRINSQSSHFKSENILNSFSFETQSVFQTLVGSLNLLLDQMESGFGEKLAKIALVSTENLQRIINNIIDIEKEEVGKLESQTTSTCLDSLLKGIWENSSLLIQKKGLQGFSTIDADLPKVVEIDGTRLSQIILNLMDYLLQVTPKGSIHMQAEYLEMRNQGFYEFSTAPSDSSSSGTASYQSVQADIRELSFNPFKTPMSPEKLRSNFQSEKMLQIIIKNGSAKPSCEKIEQQYSEIEGKYLPKLPSNSLAGLGLIITKKLCAKLGGSLKSYSDGSNETSFIVNIPFKVFVNSKF